MDAPSLELVQKWIDANMDELQESIQQSFVHKSNPDNVAITRVVRIDSKEYEAFATQVHVNQSHAFFFDHPLDHVPGMLLIEASRQMLTAIPHIFYETPINNSCILDLMTARFEKFAELGKPIFLVAVVLNKVLRQRGGIEFDIRVTLMQAGQPVGEIRTSGRSYDQRVMQRARAIGSKKIEEQPQLIMG